ncbi:MAG: PQQ-binding-like beta-propeller repeat protein [Algicola sp.]|nr:PQQ-binding-like beta-propeller repeat protein [Algicola sp.]
MHIYFRALCLAVLLSAISACGGGGGNNDSPLYASTTGPVTADAGIDYVVDVLSSVGLSGRILYGGSNADETPVADVRWQQVAGTYVDLIHPGTDTSYVTFRAPYTKTKQTLEFELSIYDSSGSLIDTDIAKVTVNPKPHLQWGFVTNDRIYADPAIADDGTVYVASTDHFIYAINPDGSEQWSYDTGSRLSTPPVLTENGLVYLATDDGVLHAFTAAGHHQWEKFLDAGIFTPGVAPDGSIYIGTSFDKLYALNPDGSTKWTYDPGTFNFVMELTEIKVANDGVIYGHTSNGGIVAFDPDGSKKWDFYGDDDNFTRSGNGMVLGDDGTIYFGMNLVKIYAVDPDGNLKWEFETAERISSRSVIAADGTIHFSVFNGAYALNSDGSVKWYFDSTPFVNNRWVVMGCAVADDGIVYVGSNGGQLLSIDQNGQYQWSMKANESITVVSSHGHNAYVGDSDGVIYSATPEENP